MGEIVPHARFQALRREKDAAGDGADTLVTIACPLCSPSGKTMSQDLPQTSGSSARSHCSACNATGQLPAIDANMLEEYLLRRS